MPDSGVRRRYGRRLANASQVLRIVHQGLVFDNSGVEPRPVLEIRKGRLLNVADEAVPSPPSVSPSQKGAGAIFEQGLGLSNSPKDAALLDEVVSIAYEEKRRPTKPPLAL